MQEHEDQAAVEDDGMESEVSLDPARVQAVKAKLKAQENFPVAVLAGVVSAIVGALIWAGITVQTGYQIGWMAVGVGFLVGFSVRILGKGISIPYGYIGALGALIGCALGNVLSAVGFFSIEMTEPFFQVASSILMKPAAVFEILKATSQPMDFLFYGLAVYEGYKFSFRQVSQEELYKLINDR